MATTENDTVRHLSYEGKDVILVGTAHVSRESVELVQRVISAEKPETVCVELCQSRYHALRQKERWQDTDIVKVIREKKAFLLLSNLLLASFQKRLAKKFDITPGEEMLKAIEIAEQENAGLQLADRDIRTTLARAWRVMGWWGKLKLMAQLLMSLGDVDDISAEDIEKMKQEDMLQTILAEVGRSMPVLKKILIDERDQYLAEKIRKAPGRKIVAVVGAGHLRGIEAHWRRPIDIESLEALPPRNRFAGIIKWIVPLVIVALIVCGFFYGGKEAGREMIVWWITANGVLAGIGAAVALGHPATILSSVLAAPLTSLNPMIAAGWVSGLVEAMSRRPKVRDLESLPEDILSIRGFWKNNVTRILLVVVFTNIGSSIGTFVAFPAIVKVLLGAT